MSASACLVAFLDSSFESAFGLRVWIVLPRLSDLLPVPAGQAEPLAGACPVMSACMQAKLIPRFLLTLDLARERSVLAEYLVRGHAVGRT